MRFSANVPSTSCCKTYFYTLPKIFKSVILPVSGQTIIEVNCSLTEPIFIYIDLKIKCLVSQLPSFLKDTTDFLTKLEEIQNFDREDFICTMEALVYIQRYPIGKALKR